MKKTKFLKILEDIKEEEIKDGVKFFKSFFKNEFEKDLTIENYEDLITDIECFDSFDNAMYSMGAMEMLTRIINLINRKI